MAEAPGLAALYEQYEADGFIVITLLGEDTGGSTPSQAELEDWADQFGIDHPVVADEGFSVTSRFVDGGTIGLPSMTLLEAGAEIVIRNAWVSESDVEAHLP